MRKVYYDPQGESGNIFVILSRAQQVLRVNGLLRESVQMGIRVYNSHSYEEALSIISEYVPLEVKRHADL